MKPDKSQITVMLEEVGAGVPGSADRLLEAVYQDLLALARGRMAGESPGHTLQATVLVNETYLRLFGRPTGDAWENRRHFFGAAAEAMRRILIDHARARNAAKRGSGRPAAGVDDEALPERMRTLAPDGAILPEIDEAIAALAAENGRAAEVVRLRFWIGMENAQIADAMGVSPRTVNLDWAYARAWLNRRLSKQ